MRRGTPSALALAALLAAASAPPCPSAWAQGMGGSTGGDAGLRVYKKANCVGCHNWTGSGGGGYGGASANLRATELTREQIAETVRCGRPGTGMPYFEREAYADGRCYGLKAADLAEGQKPPEPQQYLRPAEIEAVTDYVVARIKGRGDPTFAECQAFFGEATRACNRYREPGKAQEGGA